MEITCACYEEWDANKRMEQSSCQTTLREGMRVRLAHTMPCTGNAPIPGHAAHTSSPLLNMNALPRTHLPTPTSVPMQKRTPNAAWVPSAAKMTPCRPQKKAIPQRRHSTDVPCVSQTDNAPIIAKLYFGPALLPTTCYYHTSCSSLVQAWISLNSKRC